MSNPSCPNCHLSDPSGKNVIRWGKFFRHSTASFVRRFRCKECKTWFSEAIFDDAYRQKKRLLNPVVGYLLSHTMSQREVARFLKINFKTVVHKFRHQSVLARRDFKNSNWAKERAVAFDFDDLETFEHTKHKPLSLTLAVERESRRILDFELSQMPARGFLAKRAREKYGHRPDLRQKARKIVFERLQDLAVPRAEVRSDLNPHYLSLMKNFFPEATHKRYRGRRGCVTGQGELKEGKYDPLFFVNQTCGMLRANVNRLIRKTWCTTKLTERLEAHLYLYAHSHNLRMEEIARKKALMEASRRMRDQQPTGAA